MSIIASCGHKVEDFDQTRNVSIKAWEISEDGWTKALHYKTVCEACYKEYEEEGYILANEDEEINWLSNEGDE